METENKVDPNVEQAVQIIESKIKTFSTEAKEYTDAAIGKAFASKPNVNVEKTDNRYKSIGALAYDMIHNPEEIKTKTASGMTGGVPADGGVLIQTVVSPEAIGNFLSMEGNLLGMSKQIPLAKGRSMKIPVVDGLDLTTRSNVTTVGEGAAADKDKLAWTTVDLNLDTDILLIPVTEELMEDSAVALDAFLTEEANFQFNLSTNKKIVTTITASDAFLTLDETLDMSHDIANLVAHYVGDIETAIILMNPAYATQVFTAAVGNAPLYQNGKIYGMTAKVSALVDTVAIFDMKKVVSIYRAVETAVSNELLFDRNEKAFRFVFRWDADLSIDDAFTIDANGTKASYFVGLNAYEA